MELQQHLLQFKVQNISYFILAFQTNRQSQRGIYVFAVTNDGVK